MNANMLELFGRNGDNEYRNLKGVKLSAAARLFLCEEINGCHSIDGNLSVTGASTRYQIPRRTVRDWYAIYSSGNCFHDGNGRPTSLDAIATSSLQSKLEQLTPPTADKIDAISDEVASLIEQEKVETKKRRRQGGIASFPVSIDVLSDVTMLRIKRKLSVD